jgi:hypothetical protein
MGLHDPFGHLKHKLWPKESLGIKLPIWFPTTKSQESPQFSYVQVACYISLKNLNKGYNFSLEVTLIRGLHIKLWAPKVTRVPTLGISGLPLGSPETKWHLGVSPMVRHIKYYRGEGGGFPQVRVVVSLMSMCLPVVRLCTKVLQLLTN